MRSQFNTLFPGLGSIRRELEQAFGDVYGNSERRSANLTVPVSIWSDERQVFVELDVPGFPQSGLDVRFEDGRLTITGERTWPEDRKPVNYNERQFGRFERVIAVSDLVDPASIDAALADGVLTITLNKKVEAVPQSVRIRTRTSDAARSEQTTDHPQA